MTLREAILAAISLVSFGLTVYSFVSTRIKRANEKANVEIMRERFNALYSGLTGLFHAADMIVQLPKARREIQTHELQDLARALRAQIYFVGEQVRESRRRLDNWRFGQVIESSPHDLRGIEPPEEAERSYGEQGEHDH
jgi:hypothetical protein